MEQESLRVSKNGNMNPLLEESLPNYSALFPDLNRIILTKFETYLLKRSYTEKIDFDQVRLLASNFASMLQKKKRKIIAVLLQYESFEVASDEFERTIDLLKSLDENKSFFVRKISSVTSFLPRNQPLYALTCFAIVPSLMASEVHVRAPLAMNLFFPNLISVISLNRYFKNIFVSFQKREDFLQIRTALMADPKTGQKVPVTDAVIFTGTMENADKIRKRFDERVLFIANGAGHNPVVIAEKANIEKGAEAVLSLQLYNQGQDCANPNSILVHARMYKKFVKLLERGIKNIKMGEYKNIINRIGPISEINDLCRIQEVFVQNSDWLDPVTHGVIHTKSAIVEPTIILKPLKEGGNFKESFAPIFFVQKYEKDSELSLYFEDPRYERNAMYITVFGKSKYIEKLRYKKFENHSILHDEGTILRNTHLHALGVERGTKPYGGYGRGASSISIYGIVISKPTCPQRDIFDWIVYPCLQAEKFRGDSLIGNLIFSFQPNDFYSLISAESVQLHTSAKHSMHLSNTITSITRHITQKLKNSSPGYVIKLLDTPNVSYMSKMSIQAQKKVGQFRLFLESSTSSLEEFKSKIYSIAGGEYTSVNESKIKQKEFFCHIYNLLFGTDQGPKLDSFLFSIEREEILKLLDLRVSADLHSTHLHLN